MPEGDTIYLLATRLNKALAAQTITFSDFRVPQLATADLRGHTVTEVASRGKHILLRTDRGTTLHTHLEMDGRWLVHRSGTRWKVPAFQVRVVIRTWDTEAVGVLLPTVELLPTREESHVVGHLGPDLLGPDWDEDEAVRRISADGERAICEALIDQRVMAGLGNVYKCEVCFLAGVHPFARVGSVPDMHKVISIAKRTIEANRLRGNQITTGDTRPGRRHWVYARGGKPCLRCGTAVAVSREADRVTYWCPSCQPKK